MLGIDKDVLGDYDFSRSDKLFILKVPSYQLQDGVPYYEFNLRDLIHNDNYVSHFRYNELKNIHEILTKLNVTLSIFSLSSLPSQSLTFGLKPTLNLNLSKSAELAWRPTSVL